MSLWEFLGAFVTMFRERLEFSVETVETSGIFRQR